MSAKLKRLQEMLDPIAESMGFELWGIEYLSLGKDSVLRIYIDAEKGISVDDCAQMSHQASGILDVEDTITGMYSLEVSSPGLDRLLFKLEHYQAYIGHVLKIKLRMPFDGRRNFKGQLKGVEGDEIIIEVDNEEYVLPIDYIDKAQVEPQF
ncbi:MAG: ribosome maturation factor RimP [Oceanospirillaceae bacterium]|nr:ribosome maturation factor RimP [Oceanospirillaceae bacterium]